MSNTPRTDKFEFDYATTGGGWGKPFDFARELERENARLRSEPEEIAKLRTALNRIAHPATYGTEDMDPREIARRALVVGMKVNPLPSPANSKAQPAAQNP